MKWLMGRFNVVLRQGTVEIFKTQLKKIHEKDRTFSQYEQCYRLTEIFSRATLSTRNLLHYISVYLIGCKTYTFHTKNYNQFNYDLIIVNFFRSTVSGIFLSLFSKQIDWKIITSIISLITINDTNVVNALLICFWIFYWTKTYLIHYSPVLLIHTPWKHKKNLKGFLMISGGKD